MPTVTLTFQIPDEQAEYDETLRARVAHAALWDIDQYCRSKLKHGKPSEESVAILEDIRKAIPWECIE